MKSGNNVRAIRNVEPPRPLKSSSVSSDSNDFLNAILPVDSVEKAAMLLQLSSKQIYEQMTGNSKNFHENGGNDTLQKLLMELHECLSKLYGTQLDASSIYRGQLDQAFSVFRDCLLSDSLDEKTRFHLLQLLELRQRRWLSVSTPLNETMPLKMNSEEHQQQRPADTVGLEEGAVIGHRGRWSCSAVDSKPVYVPAKNQYKDEFIIRNSDSGKVMGMKGRRIHLIEQISQTIISLQRVQPTAKERIVQITGPTERSITSAIQLMEETIRTNSSPVREVISISSDDEDGVISTRCDKRIENLKDGEFDDEFRYLKDYELNYPDMDEIYHDARLMYADIERSNDSAVVPCMGFKHRITLSGGSQLTITASDFNSVAIAKTVLDDYFKRLDSNQSDGSDDVANICKNVNASDLDAVSMLLILLRRQNQHQQRAPNKNNKVNENARKDSVSVSSRSSVERSSSRSSSGTPTRSFPPVVRNRKSYTLDFMKAIGNSETVKCNPDRWEVVEQNFPHLIICWLSSLFSFNIY